MSSPRELYNIDFDDIKQNIKEEYPDIKDYGSSVIIDCTHGAVDVFCDGRIKIWGDKCIEVKMVVNKVKAIFKKQISEIIYDDDTDMDMGNSITAAMDYSEEYTGSYDRLLNDDILIKKINERPYSDVRDNKKASFKKANSDI